MPLEAGYSMQNSVRKNTVLTITVTGKFFCTNLWRGGLSSLCPVLPNSSLHVSIVSKVLFPGHHFTLTFPLNSFHFTLTPSTVFTAIWLIRPPMNDIVGTNYMIGSWPCVVSSLLLVWRLSLSHNRTIAVGRYQEATWRKSAVAELPHLLSVNRTKSLKV